MAFKERRDAVGVRLKALLVTLKGYMSRAVEAENYDIAHKVQQTVGRVESNDVLAYGGCTLS